VTATPSLQQLRLREHQLFLVLSIVVGVLAGLAAVLFTLAIDGTSRLFFGIEPSSARLFAVPVCASLVAGVLLVRVFPDVRGSGVPQTKAAFHLSGGLIHPRVPLGKFLLGALCIGSGHSLGREGPSVQIGAGIASVIGQWLRLSQRSIKDLVPVGAAGALSAAFNTPIAAVVFALEEIISDLNAPLLGSTVVASVTSVVVARSILGDDPLFRVPGYRLVHPAELAGYVALGVVGGLISVAFCKGLLFARAAFLRMPAASRAVQPAIGGALVGATLIVVPEVMGVGYEYVDQALSGGLLLPSLVLLGFVKLAATIVSYASGNAGGIFAPSLYIGAMAGGAVGILINRVAPFPTADPGAYALVGMGTLFAGIIRAPMTSVFMIFEITQDYQIIVPLMVANLLSFAISRRLQRTPVYEALLHQDDVHLPPRGEDSDRPVLTARDVMNPAPPLIADDRAIGAVWAEMRATSRGGCLVGAAGRIRGLVSREQLAAAVKAGRADEAIGAFIDSTAARVCPDHPIDVVLDRFAKSPGLLPVVNRADPARLEGVIVMASLTRAFGRLRPPGALDDAGPASETEAAVKWPAPPQDESGRPVKS
jgi:CIC family chloride channel protein